MKKIIYTIFTSLLILGSSNSIIYAHDTGEPHEEASTEAELNATATPVPEVNSFELFWPISAGKVKGESLYFLKSLKENLRELLHFGNVKKSDYNITLSVKRTVEVEKLVFEKKDLVNAKATLEEAQAKRQRSYDLLIKAKDEGKEIKDLISNLKTSLEKQKMLLENIKAKSSEEIKSALEENINNLDSLKEKLVTS